MGLASVIAGVLLLAAAPVSPQLRQSPYVGVVSVDAATGRELFAERADQKAYPASVTKLMTAFVVLDEVAAGRVRLDEPVVASPTRTKADVHFRQPSCTGLRPGEAMTVDELLKALMVNSANDAAIFLAEKCAGTVPAFVAKMNAKAKALGMKSTVFYNPNGLPPPQGRYSAEFNVSTCRDLARMARALLKDHPRILDYTSLKTWDVTCLGKPRLDAKSGRQIRWVNHNNVMVKDKLKVLNPDGSEAADGLKTGCIDAGGSSVILTGRRNGRRALVVVLGSASSKDRDAAAARLLNDALTALAW